MRKITLSFFAICFALLANAQAVLPTSWSFTTATLPTFWTESGTAFYTASGFTPPAMKLDNTGDFLQINFNGTPGALTYYIAGNSYAGGTFEIQESDLGVTWSTLRTFNTTTPPPNGTYTLFTDNPAATTRYIRFFYTTKVSGNFGLDEVNIAVGAAGPNQEINVKQGTTTVISSGTVTANSNVATNTPINFTIENLGLANDLNISSAVISGPQASEFVLGAIPSLVDPSGTQPLVVNFTPTANGNRNAILTINSDDADEAVYVINLNGIGGSLSSEPTSQATNLIFSNIKSYRVTTGFTAASPAPTGYLILRKTGSAITGVPTDGTAYQRGDLIGDAQVAYIGMSTSFVPNNIIANTNYFFQVFAFNGAGSNINYLSTSPASGNVTSAGNMVPAGYYSGISTAATSFVSDVHALVNPHQVQFYSNYSNFMIKGFYARDTTLGRKVITCVYSGENKIYTEPFDFTTAGYSREHTFPHSWMPTNPAQALPEYNDYHHLFPTNQNLANAIRSNFPLGEVVTASNTFLAAKFGVDANNDAVYEPKELHKGDAARAMMYESICYTTVSGNNWGFPNPIPATSNQGQNQAVLKQWCVDDAPSNLEIARNDYIDSLQGNRNPFIDNPTWVCFVNFDNVSYLSAGCAAEITEKVSDAMVVFPNPAKDEMNVHIDGTNVQKVELLDALGRVVLTYEANGQVLATFSIKEIAAGAYTLKAYTTFGFGTRSVIIQK